MTHTEKSKTHVIKKTVIAFTCLLTFTSAVAVVPGAIPTHKAEAASATKADKIVSLAQSLKGKVTYKFNVNNPSRYIFDCSSFTKYVFGKYGVSLKWSSKAQSKQGKYVSKSNLKKGDLVFFSVSTPGQVNHVGIYIGNGKFIHNTIGKSWNGVLVSKLSDYSKRYITARRVL